MKKPSELRSIAFVLLCILGACQKETICTTEFRSIGITISGDSLTDFYTVRTSTLDTLRLRTDLESSKHVYIVLDDRYQSAIAHTQERFTFIGRINTNVVVREDFMLKSDGCHVIKVSGKSEVQL